MDNKDNQINKITKLVIPDKIDDDDDMSIIKRRRMKPRPPTNEAGIRLIEYSPVSYALLGETLPYRTEISSVGCRFNPNLTDPESGLIVPGWVCKKSLKASVIDMLDKIGAEYKVY